MTIMLENREIPVILLTGYLGSGKTTLVNRILSNRKGIRFAVIVNDIGEVNVDASLIAKGGIVGKTDASLVALQNGCICCTLKMDLVEQLGTLCRGNHFDYVVIEASGICEPGPIAQTINAFPQIGPHYPDGGIPRMDCIVTVVDALRMQSEFACGEKLTKKSIADDDLENLVIQQIEFCNIILLNKASEVKPEDLGRIKSIIAALQPNAEIIPCDFCEIDLERILDTKMFDFDKVATSASWIDEIEGEGHEGEGEVEEYGIGTFVYYRRLPFNLNKFDWFVAKKWPQNIIRAKGLCYFSDDTDKCYLFEQAGVQKSIKDAGYWYATMSDEELADMMKKDASLRRDWDKVYGDRMIKIVFIGQRMDREGIGTALDACLEI